MTTKAKESPRVKRMRQKLKRQIAQEHKKMTNQALDQMSAAIKQLIRRHEGERVRLKDKAITLFDENRHSAKEKSKAILKLRDFIATHEF